MNYDEIIHEGSPSGGAPALKSRLVRFRKWATKQAGITIHPALCVVNGEATDGTRNAPVLVFESRPDPRAGGGGDKAAPEARCGAVDNTADGAMYDRSIGCQVRTVRELKGGEVALSVPASAMISPDLIAASDAGRAVRECCRGNPGEGNFWDAFGPTVGLEKNQLGRVSNNSGTQLLVKILQERKKAEAAIARAERAAAEESMENMMADDNKLANPGQISRRAPYLAFLIHQRFANERDPAVSTDRKNTLIAEGAPKTFAPYARTLPSSICLPICWRRNELALLAGCIPGMPALQKVASRTMQLAAELIALVNAGLLTKFPSGFSPGLITWDRWVWACAVYESRMIPVARLPSWIRETSDIPAEVWDACGVMVPFLDMLNHEDEAAQTDWAGSNEEDADARRLNLVTSEKTKKHLQVYRDYGVVDNEQFMLQFGFTRMSNPADKVRIAWALIDGVGGLAAPPDYEPVSDSAGVHPTRLVFDSTDAESLKAWWTEQRLSLLGKAVIKEETLDQLRKGRKITFCAFNDGKIDSILVAVAVAATLSPEKVAEMYQKAVNQSKPLDGLVLNKTDQHCVRLYLSYLFSKKLGKLLQSLNSCLKDHFNNTQLWTKASQGGLNYQANGSSGSVDGESGTVMGWQTFFDTYAWYSTMEVEQRYYSMAPDSCVLTMYDGHVRSLQGSLDVMATDEVFSESVGKQLKDLGCTLTDTVVVTPGSMTVVTPSTAQVENKADERVVLKSGADEGKEEKSQSPMPVDQGNGDGSGGNRPSDRKVNTNPRKDRAPAIKLHIGNLSYKTMPNELYEFFTKLYGADSVLECHIPTERDTGNSRGFGFVTMPEHHAKAALESGRRHEMDGRILKVAESNSAGSGGGRRGRNAAPAQSDRCANCGYRPKWCTCNPSGAAMPNMGGPPPQDSLYGPGQYGMPPPPMDGPGYGPPPDMGLDDRHMGGDEYAWGGGGGDRGGGWDDRRRSYSRSPSYRRSDRDRERGGYRRSRSYSRSRSRSYSRDRRDRDRHRPRRHRDDDRRRGRYDDDRGRDRGGRSRRYRSKSRSRSRGRGERAGSPGGRPGEEVGNFSERPDGGGGGDRGGRSPNSRSRSPVDGNGAMDRSPKKKDSSGGERARRSRSRDRGSGGGRSGRRKRSKGSRRDKGSSSSKRRGGGSRSRSRDRH